MQGWLGRWLAKAGPVTFITVAGLAGYCAYFSMYAFRKPFTAATFDAVPGWHFLLDYKIALVIAQAVGYAASKLIGVKVISEIDPKRRGWAILGLIGVAWLALIAFALAPAPWNVLALFFNGLPLGMIWGVVFSYLEGRRATELMGTILASSLIFATGLVKTVGRYLLLSGVNEFWMPFLTGLIFALPLLACVAVLERLPEPSAADRAARGARTPMPKAERGRFLRRFLPGLVLMIVCYIGLTVVRDFRDSFEAELLTEFGYAKRVGLFVQIETPIAILVLLATASLVRVRDNLRSLMIIHTLMIAGVVCAGLSTLAFRAGLLPPLWWLGLVGLGLYLAYVPFNCAFAERLIATFRGSANVGFLIYVCDTFGYLASVAVILLKESGGLHLSWSRFFGDCVLLLALCGGISLLASARYFRRKAQRELGGDTPAIIQGTV